MACANGTTALHNAASRSCPEIVKLLLEAGAEVNAKNNNGNTALDIGASQDIRNLLALYSNIYHKVQTLWEIWEIETPIFSNHLQWLPREMLEDVINILGRKLSSEKPQPSLINSELSFFSTPTVVPQEIGHSLTSGGTESDTNNEDNGNQKKCVIC